MKNSQFMMLLLTFGMTTMALAKTSIGLSLGVPVIQQNTIYYQAQPIPPTATVIGQHTQTHVSPVNRNSNNVVARPYRPMSSQEYQAYRYYQPHQHIIYAPIVTYTQPITQVISPFDQNNGIQSTTIQHIAPAQIVLKIGERIPERYRQMNYWVNDWQNYRLSSPPAGHLWMNIGGQFALVSQPDYLIIRLER